MILLHQMESIKNYVHVTSLQTMLHTYWLHMKQIMLPRSVCFTSVATVIFRSSSKYRTKYITHWISFVKFKAPIRLIISSVVDTSPSDATWMHQQVSNDQNVFHIFNESSQTVDHQWDVISLAVVTSVSIKHNTSICREHLGTFQPDYMASCTISLACGAVSLSNCGVDVYICLTGSLWCRQSQQSFNTSTRSYFPSINTCFGPYGPSSGETYNGLFLIQRIRCTYATRCIRNSPLKHLIVYLTWGWPVGAETCSEKEGK
jgi:hypothetical protein